MSDEEEHSVSDEEQNALEPAMMNEILLICSNLGLLKYDGSQQMTVMRGEDCEEWIHDLQRAIRRDSEKNRLVAMQLGKYKLVQKKLLPLLINHQHDWKLVFSILKILVMLTMKPSVESVNISQQIDFLREYKHAMLTQQTIPLLMTILLEPLSRDERKSTPQDFLNMELILTLIRNLLVIPDSNLSSGFYRLQGDLIKTLYDSHAYETLHLLAKKINSPQYRDWNFLLLEIIDLTVSYTTPSILWERYQAFVIGKSDSKKSQNLTLALQKEKRELQGRHSNFGGLITIPTCTNTQSVLSNLSVHNTILLQPRKKAKLMRNRAPPKNVLDFYPSKGQGPNRDNIALDHIYTFSDALLTDSYYQLMTVLKNDFRRGSTFQRQRIQYLRSQTQKESISITASENAVLATLDMFSFNFVLKSIEHYSSTRDRHGADLSVKLLTEKMAYVYELLLSHDLQMRRIASSIQHKLYYERDFLERIPSLIKEWETASDSVDYGSDLVMLLDIVFRGLETHETIKVRNRKSALVDNETNSAQLAESNYDVKRYFLRILSSNTIQMYARVLANYRNNLLVVNESIYAYFYRVYYFVIEKNRHRITTRSMLYDIHVLMVFHAILEDSEFQVDPQYKSFIALIHEIVKSFFQLMKRNNLLILECLLRKTDVVNLCLNIEECYAFMQKRPKKLKMDASDPMEEIADVDLINNLDLRLLPVFGKEKKKETKDREKELEIREEGKEMDEENEKDKTKEEMKEGEEETRKEEKEISEDTVSKTRKRLRRARIADSDTSESEQELLL